MLDARKMHRCMCLMAGMFPRLLHEKGIDAIFIWGRAEGEWHSAIHDEGVLNLAAEIYRRTKVPVALPGYIGSEVGQGPYGHPGPKVWGEALRILGVPNGYVYPTKGDGHNTRTEMQDYIEMAKERGWSRTIAVTQQSHALRAMLGTVKSLYESQQQSLLIVPVWPHVIDWNRMCYGSQGAGPDQRKDWIDGEYDRILEYGEKGHMATLDELEFYLESIYQKS